MKRFLSLILAVIMLLGVFTLAGCGSQGGTDNPGNPSGGTPSGNNSSKSEFPRNTALDKETGRDSIDAVLQNCHFKFVCEGNYDICDCRPVECELITCLDRFYINAVSLYGYEQLMKNKIPANDMHYAIVADGDNYTLYDFNRKIVAVSDSYGSSEEAHIWRKNMLNYKLMYCDKFYDKQSYLDEAYSEKQRRIDPYEKKEIAGKEIEGTKWVSSYKITNGSDTADYVDYLIWFDPDTKFALRYEEWVDGTENSMVDSYEITKFDLNCVKQKDVDDIINKLYKGHESEYTTMDLWDYWENYT